MAWVSESAWYGAIPPELERLGFKAEAATHFTRLAGSARLGKREREVAAHLVRGYSNAEIARRLELSPLTVKTQVKRIYCKVGVTSRAGLMWCALSGETPT